MHFRHAESVRDHLLGQRTVERLAGEHVQAAQPVVQIECQTCEGPYRRARAERDDPLIALAPVLDEHPEEPRPDVRTGAHPTGYFGRRTRSEERRVGKGWVRTCRSRGSPNT